MPYCANVVCTSRSPHCTCVPTFVSISVRNQTIRFESPNSYRSVDGGLIEEFLSQKFAPGIGHISVNSAILLSSNLFSMSEGDKRESYVFLRQPRAGPNSRFPSRHPSFVTIATAAFSNARHFFSIRPAAAHPAAFRFNVYALSLVSERFFGFVFAVLRYATSYAFSPLSREKTGRFL